MPRKTVMRLCSALFARPTPREAVGYAGAFALMLTIGYYAVIDRNPIIETESEMLTPVVMQGDEFRIAYRTEWSSDCRVTGWRVVVDGAGISYNIDPDSRLVRRGEDEFIISIPIPRAAAPGEAIYRGQIKYECNWLQRAFFPVVRDITPRQFTIASAGRPLLWNPATMQCPAERPVYVRSYCRSLPNTLDHASAVE